MSYSISTLLTRNLHDVFGENDPARRRAASSNNADLLAQLVRKLVIRFVIFARVRGTVSTRSVSAIARTAGIKNGILSAT